MKLTTMAVAVVGISTVLAMIPQTVRADIIWDVRVDFSGSQEKDHPETGNWNVMDHTMTTLDDPMDYDTGDPLSGITINGEIGWSRSGLPVDATAHEGWLDNKAIDGFWFVENEPGEIVISGLDMDNVYIVEVAAAWHADGDISQRMGDYTLAHAGGDDSVIWDCVGDSSTDGWITWEAVEPRDGGSLLLSVDQVPDKHSPVLNAMRITAVPEPASLVLLGVCGLGILLRRRR